MLGADLRKAIVTLFDKGMSKHAIARALGVSRNTVREVIAQGGVVPTAPRSDAISLDPVLLAGLYTACKGWKERVWEKLQDEHETKIGYSTLTRKIRELGLGQKARAAHVGDVPGDEMQHDTSPFRVKLGDVFVDVHASTLYFRYSKQIYLRFYRTFDRFRVKSFLHEALVFVGFSAPKCIIDNATVIVLRGTGKDAVIAEEMVLFARRYGFEFVAHARLHADRKAGEERAFFTIESNFFPGRSFTSMEDLNAQAFTWATERRANTPRAKTKLIPAVAFEYEKAFLRPVAADLPPPYRVHDRGIDQYGFVSFNANSYWTPGDARGAVKVLEYAGEIKIYQGRRLLAGYPLPPEGTKNQIFPADRPAVPYQPRHRERPSAGEEAELRAAAPVVGAFLDFALKDMGVVRHRYLRGLCGLKRRLAPSFFEKVVARALQYRCSDLASLEDIARMLVRDDLDFVPEVDFCEDLEARESFNDGRHTDPPDMDPFNKMTEDR